MKKHLTRRCFLKTSLTAVGASMLPYDRAVAGPSEAKHPNILFFMADDLGWVDSDVYSSDFYETPAMKRLAREGMTFEQAYAQPLCSPARASLLSGKYACARLHMHRAITHVSNPAPRVPERAAPDQKMCYPGSRDRLPPDEYTLAESLKSAGYQTWHLGKWHLKPLGKPWRQFDPVNRGFDVQIGVGGPGPGRYFAPYVVQDFPPGPDGEYITERMADEACKLLEKRDKNKPFFMHYCEFNVHSPYEAKEKLIDYYIQKAEKTGPGKHRNPVYAAMVHAMDEAMGKLLDKLDQLGIVDNTLVVFVSDNGAMMWEGTREIRDSSWKGHEKYLKYLEMCPTSNKPLRGHKATFYEGGVRVPMIVRWPGQVKPKSTSPTPVHLVDFYPTFLSITGGTAKEGQILDGVNLVPLFKGGKIEPRPLFCHFPRPGFGTEGGSFVRMGDYKLIRIYGEGPDRTDRYELFNLRTDIGESKDLSEKMPDKVKEMAALLSRWLEETGALIPKKNPAYNPTA